MSKPYIPYMHTGPWPIMIGFSNSEKQFKREMKRLRVPKHDMPRFISEGAGATTHTLTHPKEGTVVIICIGKRKKRHTKTQWIALIAHECVHAWQEVCVASRDTRPSDEAAAYGVQWIMTAAMDALR